MCALVQYSLWRRLFTSLSPLQNLSNTRFILPPFSMEITRVWSSSLIHMRKVFWSLCLFQPIRKAPVIWRADTLFLPSLSYPLCSGNNFDSTRYEKRACSLPKKYRRWGGLVPVVKGETKMMNNWVGPWLAGERVDTDAARPNVIYVHQKEQGIDRELLAMDGEDILPSIYDIHP